MFDGRIYRAAFVPMLVVLMVVGFSLSGRPAPLGSNLAPDAFDGPRAFAELRWLAARYPDRPAGSRADDGLAGELANTIRAAAGTAGGGFRVSVRDSSAQTPDGQRRLRTVIAERPGSTGESPIAIVAHRDAASRGSAAELSGTAALIELARVFAHSETRRTIVLVSTSGGSGGYGGMSDFLAHAGPLDGALVLGDLAGTATRRPLVLSFSAGSGTAPDVLTRTVSSAISQEAGVKAGEPSLGAQLVHLAMPLASGEQAPADAAGVPAVLVQVDGERGPSAREPVSQARLQSLGRAVLSAVYALDEGPEVPHDVSARVLLGRKTLPGWAARLLALALLLPAMLACVDAFARVRRRRERMARWLVWAASCAVPFLVASLFTVALGALGLVAAPGSQLSAAALDADGSARVALLASVLVLVLALASWPALARRLSLPARPHSDGAGLAAMLLLLAAASVAWLVNPFAALLLAPAANAWLLACEPGARPPALALGALAIGVVPVAWVAIVYAQALGLGPLALAESVVLALIGGQLGAPAIVLGSLVCGSLLGLAALSHTGEAGAEAGGEPWVDPITTRGPLTYAGPGSLGGTESALRR